MEKNAVAIYLSETEWKILHQASQYTVLSEPNIIRMLIKKHLEQVKKTNAIECRFELKEQINKKIYKNKIIRLKENDYLQLSYICKCTYFSMSNLVKYWIIPDLKKINERKRWDEEI